MKKIFTLCIFLLTLTSLNHSQEIFKKVKIFPNDLKSDIELLRSYNVIIDEAFMGKDNSLSVFLSAKDVENLQKSGIRYEILIDDWNDYYKNLPVLTEEEKLQVIQSSKESYGVEGLGYGSMGGYYTYAEINAQLDTMRARFPNLITVKSSIGATGQGRQIYSVKISDNPDVTENEPRALYTALTHAREPAGMMSVIYYMYYLLENYNTNPSVKYLVDNREIWFIPCINPDGYEYNRSTNPSGGGQWRKNRSLNSGSYGVDLNRNFGPYTYWNSPNGGSSTTPSDIDYRGPSEFSELETQGYRNFVIGKNFRTALNYHTYSNLLIYPYGCWTYLAPDSTIFKEFASDMVAMNGYSPGTAWQLLYPVRGSSDDFLYDGDIENNGKIFAMTPEVGGDADGFWPPQSRIFPLAIENLKPNLYYTWVAGDFVSLSNYQLNRQYISPGDQVEMTVTMKNKGLSGADNITVTLEPISGFVAVGNGTINIPNIPSRGTFTTSTPLSFAVSPFAPVDTLCKLRLVTSKNGVTMGIDTIGFVTGVPQFVFNDTTNNPLTLWTITATPSTPKWEATTTSFNSAPVSYTDSKTGNYASNATVTIATTNQINLTGYANPKLSFFTKWDIETQWDCGVVMISTDNGTTWSALAGSLSKPASGSGKQVPAGMPIYDGTSSNWKREEINLSAYANKSVKIKFELRTDGSLVKDGWYIDDIGIYVFSALPVELAAFTAAKEGDFVNLKWTTASELNNKGFEVQRSVDGSAWINAGFVTGAGTKESPSEYSFTDRITASGLISYRLKQTDFDGTFKFFGPVEVESDVARSFSLQQNYPNPFNPETVISYSTAVDGMVTISVYDILGKKVATLVNESQKAGSHQVSFKPVDLVSGIYFYEMVTPGFSKKLKMLYLK